MQATDIYSTNWSSKAYASQPLKPRTFTTPELQGACLTGREYVHIYDSDERTAIYGSDELGVVIQGEVRYI